MDNIDSDTNLEITHATLASRPRLSFKERTGSSPQAINAYIVKNNPTLKFAAVSILILVKNIDVCDT